MMEAIALAIILAHGWYDLECCSNKDCAPVKPNEVTVTEKGYSFRGKHVPGWAHRRSKDGQFHACVLGDGTLRCLYIPTTGV